MKEGTKLGSLESLRTKISRLHEHLISGGTRIKDAKKKVWCVQDFGVGGFQLTNFVEVELKVVMLESVYLMVEQSALQAKCEKQYEIWNE